MVPALAPERHGSPGYLFCIKAASRSGYGSNTMRTQHLHD